MMESITRKAQSSSSPRTYQNSESNSNAASLQTYSQDEIDAAYALLALSNSAPAPSADHRATVIGSGARLNSTVDEPQTASRATPEQRSLQTPPQIPASQASPLAELNTFVAAALPVREDRYVFNRYVPQPRDFTMWRCENHGSWSCQQCFHAVNP